MQIHEIKPKTKKETSKRIGRGGKRGTYSGRGIKGQRSRAGTHKAEPLIRRVIKRYPKLRGYNFNRKSPDKQIVGLSDIEKKFNTGETVSPKTLLEKGLVRGLKDKTSVVKILSNGEIKKSVIIENCLVSKSAQEKVEKAGGEIKKQTQNNKENKKKTKRKKAVKCNALRSNAGRQSIFNF